MKFKKKVIAVIQARCNSIRLPNKVIKPINGIPSILLLYKRLKKSKLIDKILIATSKDKKNKVLIRILKKNKIPYFIGDDENVLKRYYDAVKKFDYEIIVRITGDSIIIDPALVDLMLKKFNRGKFDYLSNTQPPTFPDGQDVEIFTFKALKKSFKKAKTKHEKEHVTPFIIKNKFKKFNYKNAIDFSKYRWSLDEKDDLKMIQSIFSNFKNNIYFSWRQALKLVIKKRDDFELNNNIVRNEGEKMSKTKKMWKRAKQIIPGGNMILSKRPELFHPKNWPAYYKKAKDCFIWDLDGKKYFDISLMGVGSNLLGYANSEVDNAVKKAISNSNLSSLNCPEEVELCEKLLDLHQWADMARLARTGGEASAIAVRIARAASGKNKIAFCGYHGWHDWYLSANLKKDNLKSHLMAGLEPRGVPESLKDTAIPFNYNQFEELENIVRNHDIGAVKMEVSRNFKPKKNFLNKVRNLCNKKKIILIFDECSSGFRQTFGGLHKIYGVNPDMAWFGKALGNGFGITAIIGKKEIMENAQDSFISSTFWSERSGPVAANKTLEIMERYKTWEIVTKKGEFVQKKWELLAQRNKLKIQINGIPSLSTFSINSKNWLKYKTYITQEMLKKNFLATNALFLSTKHDNKILNRYFENLDKIFYEIKNFEIDKKNIDEKLDGPVCHSGFKRLN